MGIKRYKAEEIISKLGQISCRRKHRHSGSPGSRLAENRNPLQAKRPDGRHICRTAGTKASDHHTWLPISEPSVGITEFKTASIELWSRRRFLLVK